MRRQPKIQIDKNRKKLNLSNEQNRTKRYLFFLLSYIICKSLPDIYQSRHWAPSGDPALAFSCARQAIPSCYILWKTGFGYDLMASIYLSHLHSWVWVKLFIQEVMLDPDLSNETCPTGRREDYRCKWKGEPCKRYFLPFQTLVLAVIRLQVRILKHRYMLDLTRF